MGELEAGFAKLQGEDFEYYMQTYSIILGRNSKKSTVDVDLASLGGGMNISRQHARIYYDFDRKRFALEVIGKNGCFVEGVLYLRGTSHVKLDSQDLLQIGEKKFYFLLPTKRICKPPSAHEAALAAAAAAAAAAAPPTKKRSSGQGKQPKLLGSDDAPRKESKKRKSGDGMGSSQQAAFPPPPTPAPKWQDSGLSMSGGSSGGPVHAPSPPPASGTAYSSGEVREVVAAIGSVLSDLCGPGEWMPIAELFSELQAPEHYSNICSPAKLWRVVEAENEGPVKPWAGLLALLRRYPEHFIINIKSKGHVSTEYVSLVSLVS